ncbi:MAG: hypothetical protein K8U57_10090 [Planctomycetes bacterium]|nr:hypothetical protein [Planctomycetota bacterium]
MMRTLIVPGTLAAAVVVLALVGCNKAHPTGTAPHADDHNKTDGGKKDDHGGHKTIDGKKDDHGDHKTADGKKDDHAHKPGPHGGMIVSLGKDSYHAEVVFGKGEKVQLYMLGKDETQAQALDVQELAGFVTPEGATEPVAVVFKPEPQAGDAKGKTSLFVAALPEAVAHKKFKVTVNNITIGTERFRIEFANEKAH